MKATKTMEVFRKEPLSPQSLVSMCKNGQDPTAHSGFMISVNYSRVYRFLPPSVNYKAARLEFTVSVVLTLM